jgi:hypothetical protein
MSTTPDLSADWRDLLAALEFARDRFDQWGRDRVLAGPTAQALAAAYAQRRDQLATEAHAGLAPPADLSLPPEEPYAGPATAAAARAVRFWKFLAQEVRRLETNGRLSLADSHACLNEAQERISFLRRRLDQPGADRSSSPVAHAPGSPEPAPPVTRPATPPAPRRPLLEILLDPRSIQWFLAFGGGLFVLGLVLYLYTKGVFENKGVVAVCLGAANLTLLLGGWALILRTRYQLAGRALTLLACLVMPLNLWFYHAQGLITLDGHLWVAGVAVCALYAASAWVLKDWMFVPIFLGGVAMTGLLLLADLGRFWEIAAPSTFLVALGLIAIHVERAFPPDDGPFARRQFGLAFFFSGQVLLAAGLLLLLGAQLGGHWLHPLFADTYRSLNAVPSPVVTETWGRLLALGLVLAGVYAWLYSDLVVRRIGVYVSLAAAGLLWAEVLVLELLHVQVGIEVVLATLSVTALAANFLVARLGWSADGAPGGAGPPASPIARHPSRFTALGLCLALVPVVVGVVLHVRATTTLLPHWPYVEGWAFVGAMALAAVSCRVGAHLFRTTAPKVAAAYFLATVAAELVGLAGLLRQVGLVRWEQQAWVLMLVPIAHVVAAHLYRGRAWAGPVLAAGHAATAVMLLSSLVAAAEGLDAFAAGRPLNLALAVFFAEAAVFYVLTAVLHRQAPGVYLATVTGCAAVWQVLRYVAVSDEYYTLAFALLGLALLAGYRLAPTDRVSRYGRSKAAFDCANGLLSVAFVAGGLLGLQRLAFGDVRWLSVGLGMALTAAAVLAAALVRHAAWRRWYVVMAVAQGLLTVLAVQALSTLSPWQKAELFGVVAGAALLVVGHLGWYRERERENDLVSFSLGLGSLLVGVPLTVAVLYHRSVPAFSWLDELGLLTGGLLLLASGFVFQVKSTTLTGAGMVTVYVVTLLLFARGLFERLQTAALWLVVGGGLIFVIGLVLAVYRDRLLTLPERVKNREGVFRVLSWR